ncbi:immune inhibitor A, partial [Aduncisulcus paluster]
MIPSVGGYCRDELQNIHGGDWARKTEYSFDDIDSEGIDIMLSAASGEERQYDDLIRIDLPTKTTRIARPTSGNKCYFTGVGNNLSNTMTTRLDLTGASTAEIEFKA